MALLDARVLRYMQHSTALRDSGLSPESLSCCNSNVEIKKMDGIVPSLAMILVGTKKDSATYVLIFYSVYICLLISTTIFRKTNEATLNPI